MSESVLVIGSGPSGVHAAATLLSRGFRVRMLDVGHMRPEPVRADASLNDLKRTLPDPTEYFLGNRWEALVLNDDEEEYYGFPPGKQYVFQGANAHDARTRGFDPLFSHAAGGLAEAWTGGSYPFDERDLGPWPFGWQELAPYYGRVAERIGISGSCDDDMVTHFPVHAGVQPPVPADAHTQKLLSQYEGARSAWLAQGARLGRARIATLSRPLGHRNACHQSGRCQWGCPTDAFYTPSITLRDCMADDAFEYVPGHEVTHLALDGSGRATAAVAKRVDGVEERFEANRILMAAGTLSTARIVLTTLALAGEEIPELTGLMDNRQVMMPFVNLALVGKPFEAESYQYHQLALGLDPGGSHDYVHGLITTLTTALVHPVVQSMPFSMKSSLAILRSFHSALALLNVNFADDRRSENRVGLERGGDDEWRLTIAYTSAADESERLRARLRTLRRLLLRLGCVAPPMMTRPRPMGASVHYAGTFPMSGSGGDWTTDANGALRGIEGVWLVDGSSFPSLPAKNLTFTLMANACRIAEEAF